MVKLEQVENEFTLACCGATYFLISRCDCVEMKRTDSLKAIC